jgi:hypothetical protein
VHERKIRAQPGLEKEKKTGWGRRKMGTFRSGTNYNLVMIFDGDSIESKLLIDAELIKCLN